MHSSIKITALAAVATLSIIGLSACSSSSSSSEASAAPSSSMVGGMTECTEAVLSPEALKAAQAINAANTFETQDVACDNGWAVVTGILGSGEESAEGQAEADAEGDGPQGAPTSLIFQAEGQFWIPKTATDVCGTIDGTTYPADAQIPEALFTAGCLAG